MNDQEAKFVLSINYKTPATDRCRITDKPPVKPAKKRGLYETFNQRTSPRHRICR